MTAMTASLEDYLETIYVLQSRAAEVRLTDIAAELSVSKPSVSRAVITLRDHGYVEHALYGRITLTAEGKKLAQAVLQRHITLKGFLMDTLSIPESIAEQDACRMEHVISGETMDRLTEFLQRLKK